MYNITTIGLVVIAISAIMAWVTAKILKNVELKPKIKTFLIIIYFVTTVALGIGFLLVASMLFK